MKKLILTIVLLGVAMLTSAQNVAAVKERLAAGANAVTVTEKGDVEQTVRSVEARPKRTKVNGYTILILSDNSQTARENANKAKQTFEENFPDVKVEMYYQSPSFYVAAGRYLTKEEAILELWRFRTVFPKAIIQSREVDISEFIIRPELEVVEPELEDE
ncbi:MAG: hypothetical protein J6Q31_07215 [Alistipes sp.]|nr:hypothetical protein [Alistipes sp.]MBO7195412.1 hypothetical protein [Alistipes sp.]